MNIRIKQLANYLKIFPPEDKDTTESMIKILQENLQKDVDKRNWVSLSKPEIETEHYGYYVLVRARIPAISKRGLKYKEFCLEAIRLHAYTVVIPMKSGMLEK
jgi:hypothetical protein